MQREIANVAAACALQGFRYMAFPPVGFDAPESPEPAVEPEAPLELEAVPALAMEAEGAPVPVQAEPVWAEPLPPPPEPPASIAVTAQAAPTIPELPYPQPAPARAAPERRAAPDFALLAEVSAEIRRNQNG